MSFAYHVICMSLVYTRMSSIYHSLVLVCHPYVTRMYSYVIHLSLVCGFTMNPWDVPEKSKVIHDRLSTKWTSWRECHISKSKWESSVQFLNNGKTNFHNKGKTWKNASIRKLSVSEIFCVKQKFMQFPNHGMSEFPYYGKSIGTIFQKYVFLNISCEAESDTISEPWDEQVPIFGTSMGKYRQFPGSTLPWRFRVSGNPLNFQFLGMCKFS